MRNIIIILALILSSLFMGGCFNQSICGDNICMPAEKISCPRDCGDYYECGIDKDCDDEDPLTQDYCKDRVCVYESPICEYDTDCFDENDYTKDICNDGVCEYDTLECISDEDCDNQDEYTVDLCEENKCNSYQLECVYDEDCDDDISYTVDVCDYNECVSKEIDAVISIATIKEAYAVNEIITLTDPPTTDKYGSIQSLEGECGDGVCSFSESYEICPQDCMDSFPETLFPELIVLAGDNIITSVGQPTSFFGEALSSEKEIISYKWDFDGDGNFEYQSEISGFTTHLFERSGTYYSKFQVIDEEGIIMSDVIVVQVKDNLVQPTYLERSANVIIPPSRNSIQSETNDLGDSKTYVVMINGGSEERFWVDVELTYATLTQYYGLSDSEIYLLNYDGENPEGQNPNNMIDYSASNENLDIVFSELAGVIDNNDQLFVWIDDHGAGYFGEGHKFYGYSYTDPHVDPLDEKDYLESEFKFRSLFVGGDYRRNIGLGDWGVYKKYSSYYKAHKYYRTKYLSHYVDLELENETLISNDDVYIHTIIDYLKGDTNKNGFIETQEGEVYDFDGDGIFPYDHDSNSYDEDDWGKPDIIRGTNYDSGCNSPNLNQNCIYDSGLDNIVDIDMHYGDELIVDGSDLDNQGLFDGIDVNGDGDKNDWVSMDEYVSLYSGRLFDDDLKVYLDSVNPASTIVFLEPCFSGGFIDDLSGPNRVIMAATIEEDYSWGNVFVRNFDTAIKDPSVSDENGDGMVSMIEAFNYASENDGTSEIPQYDDNGDTLSHTSIIPNGGDGTLGATSVIGTQISYMSKLENLANEELVGTLVFEVYQKQNEIWNLYGENISLEMTLWPQDVVKLDLLFNPEEFIITEPGDYKVYTAFLDNNGQVITTLSGDLEAEWGFVVE